MKFGKEICNYIKLLKLIAFVNKKINKSWKKKYSYSLILKIKIKNSYDIYIIMNT